jgi:hypothetical protein
VIVDVAVLDVSATLVAVTVTVCCAATVAGAAYRPAAETVPAPLAGEIVHVTDVFAEFVTVAVNCCVWASYKVLVAGVIDTLTGAGGFNVIVAVADLDESATLVARIVTV